jgi:hypothetical protein
MMDTKQTASEVDPTIVTLQGDPSGDPNGDTPPDTDTGPPKG